MQGCRSAACVHEAATPASALTMTRAFVGRMVGMVFRCHSSEGGELCCATTQRALRKLKVGAMLTW